MMWAAINHSSVMLWRCIFMVSIPKFFPGEKVKIKSSIYMKLKPGDIAVILEAQYGAKKNPDTRYEIARPGEDKGLVFDENQLEVLSN